MAYYSGSANDISEVRAALVAACVAEGWGWDSGTEMLSKGVMFLRLQMVSGYLTLLGRTSATGGDAPSVVRMGQIGATAITWPVAYSVFVFDDEVYCVIRYNVDYHLWCAFGRSTVSGLPGTGMWVAASCPAATSTNPQINSSSGPVSSSIYICPALFWRTLAAANSNEYWVHSDLDAQGWWNAQTVSGNSVGISPSVPLIGILPNNWNSESVLLPIRSYKFRPSSKITLTVDLLNARYTRVDNYSPGEIIQIGGERWMILPFYRKNSAERDGYTAPGGTHTGTFGWAIRYEGP